MRCSLKCFYTFSVTEIFEGAMMWILDGWTLQRAFGAFPLYLIISLDFIGGDADMPENLAKIGIQNGSHCTVTAGVKSKRQA